MALSTVTLKWSIPDLIQSGLSGTLSIVPTAQLSDSTDHELIPAVARTVTFSGGTGQLAGIVANDNANILPAGTGYLITVVASNGQVIVPQFQTQLLTANGATQWLDQLAVVPVVTTSFQYLPLPSGTPAAGQVPVVQAAANSQTAWGSAGGWLPSDNGLLAACGGDPGMLTSTAITIAGTLYLAKLPIRYAMTISNLWFEVATIGAGTSSTTFAGLYSSAGTLLTGSSDVSTPLKSQGPAQCPLTTPQALAAGTFVWAALLTNLSVTQPTLFKGATATGNVPNLGLTAATYRWAVNGTSLSALPSPSITPASNTATGLLSIWAGAS